MEPIHVIELHAIVNMTFLGLPRDASPRLKAIQGCQMAIALLTIVATFLAAIVPQKHKAFTFGLLYPLILISCSTTFVVVREQRRAREGTLTKDKYVKYQLFKLFAAFGLAFLAFVLSLVLGEKKVECDVKRPGEQGLWLGCIKVNKWQALILWMNAFNCDINFDLGEKQDKDGVVGNVLGGGVDVEGVETDDRGDDSDSTDKENAEKGPW
ncbi:hypothetical protein SLS60_008051 [Paraconiothyrium brasiliense]|uniref:Uncharacterized protein n=1 Tax=Paraconiothyrium brasiliense TaxID=300254 RepID=A0ABR3R3C7_9PLEO